jgi:hypothetical protein
MCVVDACCVFRQVDMLMFLFTLAGQGRARRSQGYPAFIVIVSVAANGPIGIQPLQ